mmetsp:Transcript_9193/g.18804  ORF Transcript_9193/g.18804 Transcript_9193/m.18804 type:complete len:111 (-) Transcript_9193:9-341(-)
MRRFGAARLLRFSRTIGPDDKHLHPFLSKDILLDITPTAENCRETLLTKAVDERMFAKFQPRGIDLADTAIRKEDITVIRQYCLDLSPFRKSFGEFIFIFFITESRTHWI